MEAAGVVLPRRKRQRDAAGDLVAGDDGRQHVGARRPGHLPGSERGRDDGTARVQRPGRVRVVEVERVAQCAIQQRSTSRSVTRAVAEHAAVARRHAQRAYGCEHRRGALGVVPGAHDIADKIEHQEAGALDDGRRQGRKRDVGAECG